MGGSIHTRFAFGRFGLLLSCLLTASASFAAAAPPLPRPSYSSSYFAFVYADAIFADDASFQAAADEILRRMPPGPYVGTGMVGYVGLDAPWSFSPLPGALSSPSEAQLEAVLGRSAGRGLGVHFGALAGVSRGTWLYAAATDEDRRNCQWYADGTTSRPGQDDSGVWMTPSRYARKLRLHLETKVRLFARMLVRLRRLYPDALVSASGDGEMELNSGALDDALPPDGQLLADYSPFAILEFRDWIRHSGLYAPGGPFEGQGYELGGARYQGDGGLPAFAQDFGASFSTWDLARWNWTLSDWDPASPATPDPAAIPREATSLPGWTANPTSGPNAIPGGFDAPRSPNGTDPRYWNLWKEFRTRLVAHYVQDFARWMTTEAESGETFPVDRWYTHQIPADYLFGACPGQFEFPRLVTSASPMRTGLAGPWGSLGLTAFDLYVGGANPATARYLETSRCLFGDVGALQPQVNWGIVEYSPSWPDTNPDGSLAQDPDVAAVARRIQRAFDAGAHVLCYHPWSHFVGTNVPEAFNVAMGGVAYGPRDSATVAYLPPPVTGVEAGWFSATVTIRWSDQVFPDVASFPWTKWPGFGGTFEVWRGTTADFGTADGTLVRRASGFSAPGIVPDETQPFYRVRALNSAGEPGALSDAVTPVRPAGAAFYTLTPCRLLDTREAADGVDTLGGPEFEAGAARVFAVAGRCGVPPLARALSANVTVVAPEQSGHFKLFPGDAAPGNASTVNFAAGAVRANNATLPLSEYGEIAARNGSAGRAHLLIDVNGYFR